jgi:hypothetical protein
VGTGLVYVSMTPGVEPGGSRVAIRRLAGGATVGSRMMDGGFDPVAVEAEAGDTLAIAVVHQNGVVDTTYGVVPIKGRPTIVRTSPAEGRTDVPLNSIIQIVFNEPMDSVSLGDALHLQLQGVDVPGTVSGVSTGDVILSGQLVPTASLSPSSVYQVLVSPDARSLDGATLAAPLSLQFTTTSLSIPVEPPPPPGTIQVNVHTDGAPLEPDGYTIILDNGSSGQAAPANGGLLLTDVPAGDHRVRLEGVGGNCWISGTHGGLGDVPGTGQLLPPVVRVPSGETVPVTFDLVCFAPGANAIDVHIQRSGDPFSYFKTLILSRPDGLSRPITEGVIDGLPNGSYQLWLTGGTPFHIQCSVAAPDPRTVDLPSDSAAPIVFQLFCSNN